MSSAYLWLKAFHIISVVTWFAALFYLPRLFVYHSITADQPGRERFRMMEDKLSRIIMRPSMIVATGAGLGLLYLTWDAYGSTLWLWIKLSGVVLLLAYHYYCLRLVRAFAEDASPHSERFYRIFNEVPALLLILIVILVVVKPF